MIAGENIFHMHLDGRIGKLQPKNQMEKHSSRFLFSIVPVQLEDDVCFLAPDRNSSATPNAVSSVHTGGSSGTWHSRSGDRVADAGVDTSSAGDNLYQTAAGKSVADPQAAASDTVDCGSVRCSDERAVMTAGDQSRDSASVGVNADGASAVAVGVTNVHWVQSHFSM